MRGNLYFARSLSNINHFRAENGGYRNFVLAKKMFEKFFE